MKALISLTVCLVLSVQIYSQTKMDKWQTYFEKSGYTATPHYEETMEYFRMLDNNSSSAKLITFGISPQNRELKCLVVWKDSDFDPASVKNKNKPVIMMINGIHSGEIEGKDASMLLLREILITKEKESLLDSLILLVIPIFSVDAHENMSKYNRINQNGPVEMGWRTTSQNYNLNRDWLKADATEMQAMLRLIAEWQPDFIIDSHTTDGADYQYTVTYSVEKFKNIFVKTAAWISGKYIPYLEDGVNQKGFLIYPYIYFRNWAEGYEGGIIDWAATPRFSTGYAALLNRPSLLIETHMLKPYKDRVFATKAVFETTLDFIYKNSSELIKLNEAADKGTLEELITQKKYMPIEFSNTEKYKEINFKGYKYSKQHSDISGGEKIVYTDKPEDFTVEYYNDVIAVDSVSVPGGYFIPAEWYLLADRLKLHGIQVDKLAKDTSVIVTKYRFTDVKFPGKPYEGRFNPEFNINTYSKMENIPAGTYFVNTNQKGVRIIVHLLEPKSSDSFIRYGFMNLIFEQKEYYEDYVMEKLADKMLSENPKLKTEFEKLLSENEEFKNNFRARLDFFYERSPYIDKRKDIYPILRLE